MNAKATKKQSPAGLQAHSAGRSNAVVKKMRAAMKAVEAEISTHLGVYPFNGGRLSQAEICRRAGISQVTLLGKAHKLTLKKEVDAWLKRVQLGMKRGKKSVRKAVTERADAWKASLDQIAQRYLETNLELDECRAMAIDLKRENEEQKAEIVKLQAALSKGRVVPIR